MTWLITHARHWPFIPAALLGACFAVSVGHIETAMSIAIVVSYFSVTSFFRFRCGLGYRSTFASEWFGSLGCLLALATGASFFGLFGYDGFPAASVAIGVGHDNSELFRFIVMMLCPLAAGVFTYYFLELTLRIRHPRTYLNVYALCFCGLLGAAIGGVYKGLTYGLTGLMLSGIVCFSTGGLISAGFLSVVAVRMVFRRLVFDVMLMSLLVLGYYAGSAHLMKAYMSGARDSITALALWQTLILIFCLIAWTIVGLMLARAREARSRGNSTAAGVNMPNPNLLDATVRSVAGLASNYSVLLSPIALLAFRRNLMVLQNELSAHFAIDIGAEKLCRSIAAEVAFAHILAITIPSILALVLTVESPVMLGARVVCCAFSSVICWRVLSRVDVLMRGGS